MVYIHRGLALVSLHYENSGRNSTKDPTKTLNISPAPRKTLAKDSKKTLEIMSVGHGGGS